MPPKTVPPEAMSAEEKFNALANLKDKLEDNFISLGQVAFRNQAFKIIPL